MQKIKKVFTMIFFSALIGFILGFITYKSYARKIDMAFSSNNLSYAFQVGVYNSKEKAEEEAQNLNGIVIPEEDFYRVYIAVVTNATIKDELSNYYNKQGIEYYIRDLKLNNELKEKLEIYETLLASISENEYPSVIKKMINEYEKGSNI